MLGELSILNSKASKQLYTERSHIYTSLFRFLSAYPKQYTHYSFSGKHNDKYATADNTVLLNVSTINTVLLIVKTLHQATRTERLLLTLIVRGQCSTLARLCGK